MPEKDPNERKNRQEGAIRGLMIGVPLPIKGKPSYETLCDEIRKADGCTNGRYSANEKAKIHTARLLVDKQHPIQAMHINAGRQVTMALAEFLGCTFIPPRDWEFHEKQNYGRNGAQR